jgi:hypothetical protein
VESRGGGMKKKKIKIWGYMKFKDDRSSSIYDPCFWLFWLFMAVVVLVIVFLTGAN